MLYCYIQQLVYENYFHRAFIVTAFHGFVYSFSLQKRRVLFVFFAQLLLTSGTKSRLKPIWASADNITAYLARLTRQKLTKHTVHHAQHPRQMERPLESASLCGRLCRQTVPAQIPIPFAIGAITEVLLAVGKRCVEPVEVGLFTGITVRHQ